MLLPRHGHGCPPRITPGRPLGPILPRRNDDASRSLLLADDNTYNKYLVHADEMYLAIWDSLEVRKGQWGVWGAVRRGIP